MREPLLLTDKTVFTAIGIMSGTSCDGIDVAVCRVERNVPDRLGLELLAYREAPYEASLRNELLCVGGQEPVEALRLSRLNMKLGEAFAIAAEATLVEAGLKPDCIDVIGSHGHTVAHEAPNEKGLGATLQIGEAAVLAERLHIPVISNFRARDIAAGGQGAPLVPYFDRLYFSDLHRNRVALNIGGISNLTYLPALSRNRSQLAFDTGPGNMLIDGLVRSFTSGKEQFDRDGMRAALGKVNEKLLNLLLRNPYFEAEPPKSTGREQFGEPMLQFIRGKGKAMQLSEHDLLCTTTALTAHSIALAIERFLLPRGGVDDVIVSGGGAKNGVLLRMLQERLSGLDVRSSEAWGLRSDAKEALAFAVLACETMRGIPANVPDATGAAGPRILGQITLP